LGSFLIVMNSPDKLSVNKPTSIWKRPVELKFGKLLPSLGKGAIDAATLNWGGAAKDGVDVVAALGLKREPSQIAWLLIQKSLLQAMGDLAASNHTVLEGRQPDERLLCPALDQVLETSDLALDASFFQQPAQLPIVEALRAPYQVWLQAGGLEEALAQSISYRLPAYFVFALNREWAAEREVYGVLKAQFDTPFREAGEREQRWSSYLAWLQRWVDEPLFSLEAFSLKQVYVPLRAYYDLEIKEKVSTTERVDLVKGQLKRVVVDLQTELEAWLRRADKDDAIRVICGGPGCGKSSFSKIFAAACARRGECRVLLIPLHLFEPAKDLVEALGNFIDQDLDGLLPPNPLKREDAQPRLLLIFDGLDELAMQGKVAAEVAQQFVIEVKAKLMQFNQRDTRLQVMITGRELVIQSNANQFRNSQQVLHVLPYFQSEKEIKQHSYLDEQGLLGQDQRQVWWQKYGALTGLNYAGLPSELNRDQLREITAQPLLNYLVALSFTAGDLDFSQETNLNNIYADLLERIYRRDWERYQHRMLGDISREQFIRIQEEIVVACWHGNGRTTTVGEIEKHFAASGLQPMLEIFQERAKTGVTHLLTVFYFRQSEVKGSENTFEFTHKSFGEYLTAKRIVREVELIKSKLILHDNNYDLGWNKQECLTRWAMLCGATTMDHDLLSFIRNEIVLRDHEQVTQWQRIFCYLISTMLCEGMPMENLIPRPSYLKECRQARNAEEALLAVLYACAFVTQQVSKIAWETRVALGTWLARLQGQRSSWDENSIAYYCLGYLDASQQNLSEINLRRANLQWANLQWADLQRANLEGANLEGANLAGTILAGAILAGAILYRVNLVGAILKRAILFGAGLRRSDLQEVDLDGVSLEGVIFIDEESPEPSSE